MASIKRRSLALDDLEAIWHFIAEDNIDAADRWLDRIEAQLKLIGTTPYIGRPREELAPGLRSFSIGRYVIFYLVMETGIDIVRVLHTSLDIESQVED